MALPTAGQLLAAVGQAVGPSASTESASAEDRLTSLGLLPPILVQDADGLQLLDSAVSLWCSGATHGGAIGLDLEWRPRGLTATGGSGPSDASVAPVALLQLASRKEVFVVDLLALVPCPQPVDDERNAKWKPSGPGQQERPEGYAGRSSTRERLIHEGVETEAAHEVGERRALYDRLNEALRRLFTAVNVRKLGFASRGDLTRLDSALPGAQPSVYRAPPSWHP